MELFKSENFLKAHTSVGMQQIQNNQFGRYKVYPKKKILQSVTKKKISWLLFFICSIKHFLTNFFDLFINTIILCSFQNIKSKIQSLKESKQILHTHFLLMIEDFLWISIEGSCIFIKFVSLQLVISLHRFNRRFTCWGL